MKQLRVWLANTAWLVAAALFSIAGQAGVATSKHNLSVAGPGAVKAAAETEICVFCHAPHNAAPAGALWNRRAPTTTYEPYTSSTTRSSSGQPNGASLLCLNCHDGNVAAKNISAELAKASTHALALNTGLHNPAEAVTVNARHVECADCHNPHGISSTQGNATNDAKLINFDTSVVTAVSASVPTRFVVTGVNRGSCYLVCHGRSHNPLS